MQFVVWFIAGLLMTPIAIQQKPSKAQDAALQTRDAIVAELMARADAVFAEEGLRLWEEDRRTLRDRIEVGVQDYFDRGNTTLENWRNLEFQVERVARIIVAAGRSPSLAEALEILGDERFGLGASSKAAAAAAASISKPPWRCYSPPEFDRLVAHVSNIVATEPNSSRVNVALTAVLVSTNEPRPGDMQLRPGDKCVDRNRLDSLLRELDALLSQPTRSQAPSVSKESTNVSGGTPAVSSGSLAATGSPAAANRATSTTAAPKTVIMAPWGIVRSVLNALCPYPFCL